MSLSNYYCMRLITFSLGHHNLSTLLLESIYVLPITNQCTCPFVEEWRNLHCTQKNNKLAVLHGLFQDRHSLVISPFKQNVS